jgi:hypothetical protein
VASGVAGCIERWSPSGGAERANYVMFLTERCALLELPQPEPARDDGSTDYRFEYPVKLRADDGKASTGRIDLYRKNCFVLEAKQGTDEKLQKDLPLFGLTGNGRTTTGTAKRGTDAYRLAMQRARRQAEGYAKALPTAHGWPRVLLVVDVGHSIECFGDFSLTPMNYSQCPDVRSFRIGVDLHYRSIEHGNHKCRIEAANGAGKTRTPTPLALMRDTPGLVEPNIDPSSDTVEAALRNGYSGRHCIRRATAGCRTIALAAIGRYADRRSVTTQQERNLLARLSD